MMMMTDSKQQIYFSLLPSFIPNYGLTFFSPTLLHSSQGPGTNRQSAPTAQTPDLLTMLQVPSASRF